MEPEPHLELTLSSHPSPPPDSHRFFTCNYCHRKFYSSQALGGHQNAHKFDRSLVKKRRPQMDMALGPHSSSSGHTVAGKASLLEGLGGARHHVGRFEQGVGAVAYKEESGDEVDLSLRL